MKDHLDPDQGTKLEVLNPTHEDLLDPPSASQTCIVNDINKVCLEDNKRLLTYLPATLYLALPIS